MNALYLTVIIMTISSFYIWYEINKHLYNEPYMDEIFHVRQTLKYCIEKDWFSWDIKITTPPGLYIIATIASMIYEFLFYPFMIFKNKNDSYHDIEMYLRQLICSVSGLRLLNLFFGIGIIIVFKKIISEPSVEEKNKNGEKSKNQLENFLKLMILANFPISFFFHHLYYTDSGSTFFIFLSFYTQKTTHPILSGIFGFFALTFRQTNIIWISFIALYHIIYIYSIQIKRNERTRTIKSLLKFVILNVPKIFKELWPHLINLILFVLFVYKNNGIVLGMK